MRFVALALAAVALFAQSGSKSDHYYACRRNENPHARHECKCPGMVYRIVNAAEDKCQRESTSQKQLHDCEAKIPDPCAIIQNPDKVEPANTCQRWCRAPQCECIDDHAPCTGPDLIAPDAGSDEDNQP